MIAQRAEVHVRDGLKHAVGRALVQAVDVALRNGEDIGIDQFHKTFLGRVVARGELAAQQPETAVREKPGHRLGVAVRDHRGRVFENARLALEEPIETVEVGGGALLPEGLAQGLVRVDDLVAVAAVVLIDVFVVEKRLEKRPARRGAAVQLIHDLQRIAVFGAQILEDGRVVEPAEMFQKPFVVAGLQ